MRKKGRSLSVYIKEKDYELIEWLEKNIEKGVFRNASHAVTLALKLLKEKMEMEKMNEYISKV